MFKAALFLVIAFASTSLAHAQTILSSGECVQLLDEFRPFATTTSRESFRSSEWGEQQKLSGSVDFDMNGKPEEIYLLTGHAPSLYRNAWHMLVLIEPSAMDRTDGHVASDRALRDMKRQEGQQGVYVRAYPLASLNYGFRIKGTEDGKKLPNIAYAFAEVGMLEGKPALKLRGEPDVPGYDHGTGTVNGEPVRYEFLARFSTEREIEVLCAWKLTVPASK